MFEKIKTTLKHPHVSQLKDVRLVGLVGFCVIALLVSYNGLGAIQTNYVLQKQIAQLEQQNNIRELENNNLKLKNEYFNTDQYLELQARRLFGKAAPGETIVLIPKQVALANSVENEQLELQMEKSRPEKPTYQKNFEAWIDFFLFTPS